MSGVLIFKGIKPGFRPGDVSISIDENGKSSMSATLCTSYSTIPIWLKAAKDNLRLAKAAKEEIDKNWNIAIESRGDLLLAELTPSIQVSVACAIAIDALFDLLKPLSGISSQDMQAWRNNRTKRSARIFQVLVRLYKLQDLKKRC